MLPDPTLTFTIPSIHDGTILDCRVYHPLSPAISDNIAATSRWNRDAAILAHPYAPMGGCLDDPLVDLLGAQFLRRGFLLGTFNFRGAGHSAGRTSWTARPERDDYSSFIGFLVYYMHHLDPPRSLDDHVHVSEQGEEPLRPSPVLLLGGYSYGAMVTSLLPPIDHLLERFGSPVAGSEAAQIRQRAAELAEQQNAFLGPARSWKGRHPGNDDDDDHHHHHSHVDEKDEEGDQSVNTAHPAHPESPPAADDRLLPLSTLKIPKPAYLLISPLRGLVSHMATMSLTPFTRNQEEGGGGGDAAEAKLAQNQTLAVYGDDDIFVPVGRLRAWAGQMAARPGSRFRYEEIASAGHFWSQEGVLDRMMNAVDDFAGELLGVEPLRNTELG